MRLLVVIMLVLTSKYSFSQVSDTTQARTFWNDNLQAILAVDVAKVMSQTHYPLAVNKGSKREKLTKEQFNTRYKTIFTERVLAELRRSSVNSIDAWVMSEDDGETYMIVCMLSEEDESAVVLCFKQFEGLWQLFLVDYHME